MSTITKTIGAIALVLAISLCVNTSLKAQSPADDPGIGGPGSPGDGPGGDGGPIVPFDNNLNLLFIATAALLATQSEKFKKVFSYQLQ